MRNVFVAVSSFFTLLCLPAEDYPPMEIKTIYGQTYKNAQIVSVNNATVDITYLDSNNIPVMRGIKLKELTPELQAAFGYDPAAAAENERKQAAAQQIRFNQLRQQDVQLQKKIALQIQQRQSGQNVPVDLNELYEAVYLGKSAISGYVVTFDQSGALVNVTGDNSELQNIPDNIIILDLNAPAKSNWTGYIYPTMMINPQRLPVYCVSPENAIRSIVTTLKLDQADNDTAVASTQTAPATVTAPSLPYSGSSTYQYTTVYVAGGYGGGYYYPNYYRRCNYYPWPDYVRPCPPRPWPPRPPCPPKHNDRDDSWNNQFSDSKWIRRTNDNGNVTWVKRPQPNNHNRPGQDNNNNNNNGNNANNNNNRNTKIDMNGENRWVKPTDLRPYNRNTDSTASIQNNSNGSRWSRRTQQENIGHVPSQIPNNSNRNNSDNRWIRESLNNGGGWVRNDGSQPQAITPRSGAQSYNNSNNQRGDGGWRGNVTPRDSGSSSAGRSGGAAPSPNTGSGFTGGTVGGGWGGRGGGASSR